MKKNVLVIAFLAIAVLFSNETNAQKFPKMDKSPLDMAMLSTKKDGVVAKVVFSRPQLKGRSMAKLAPAGKVWRLGANESTEVRFYKDVMFGGKSVKAGTYTMYAIPGNSEWTIILNNKLHTWGSRGYKQADDFVRVTGKVSKGSNFVEALSIIFSKKGEMHIGWANTVVTVPVK